MSFEEVGSKTSNFEGVQYVSDWLDWIGTTKLWNSPLSHYIKFPAQVVVWERLFETTFYTWEDVATENFQGVIVRCESYSLQNHWRPMYQQYFIPSARP